jgi:hypothetical protein
MMNVVMLNVIMLSVIMLNVVMVNLIMLNVEAPIRQTLEVTTYRCSKLAHSFTINKRSSLPTPQNRH